MTAPRGRGVAAPRSGCAPRVQNRHHGRSSSLDSPRAGPLTCFVAQGIGSRQGPLEPIPPVPSGPRRLGAPHSKGDPAVTTALETPPWIRVTDAPAHVGRLVEVRGWIGHRRSSGKVQFLVVRDGSGILQCVAGVRDLTPEAWEACATLTQESAVIVRGELRADARAPGGVEMGLREIEVVSLAEPFPISPKEHGTDFLMDHRHLWLRSTRQHAILRIRNELEKACRDFFYDRDFVLIDSPILTANAAEGTTTLFETDYFGEKAFLSQSGQLYLEPAAAAFGKVYCFGPTFRAEKSKTRRHLMELWMVEPEVAFLEFDGLQELAEEFIVSLVYHTT